MPRNACCSRDDATIAGLSHASTPSVPAATYTSLHGCHEYGAQVEEAASREALVASEKKLLEQHLALETSRHRFAAAISQLKQKVSDTEKERGRLAREGQELRPIDNHLHSLRYSDRHQSIWSLINASELAD